MLVDLGRVLDLDFDEIHKLSQSADFRFTIIAEPVRGARQVFRFRKVSKKVVAVYPSAFQLIRRAGTIADECCGREMS